LAVNNHHNQKLMLSSLELEPVKMKAQKLRKILIKLKKEIRKKIAMKLKNLNIFMKKVMRQSFFSHLWIPIIKVRNLKKIWGSFKNLRIIRKIMWLTQIPLSSQIPRRRQICIVKLRKNRKSMNFSSNHPALVILSFVQLLIVLQFKMLYLRLMDRYQLIILPLKPLIRQARDI